MIVANTTNTGLVRLCERLLAAANGAPASAYAADAPPGRRPGHFGKVFLADNGSTAVEIALKMAIQAQAQRGQPARTQFASLRNGYHGETLATLSVGDCGLYAAPYEALLFPVAKLDGLPTGAVPTTRAGSTPRRSGRRSRRRWRRARGSWRRSSTSRCCRRRGRCSFTVRICCAGCGTGRARTGFT